MTLQYIAPQVVIPLEQWFYKILRSALPTDVFLVVSYKGGEKHQTNPNSLVRITYEGLSVMNYDSYSRNQFKFRIHYQVATPISLLSHHSCLELVEKGREALWQQQPSWPADAFPLSLLSEESFVPKDGCGCIEYQQIWSAESRVIRALIPNGDPCMGANEPGSILPGLPGYLAIFELDLQYILIANKNFDALLPQSNGSNQPWLYNGGIWSLNQSYNPAKQIIWGNLPIILAKYMIDWTHQP